MGDNVSDLVLSLADCKQLLGLRYAEWCSATPTLEADIAAAAMGLDDLGHSRVLAGCLSELGADPRGPERETDPAAYRNVAFLDDTWTEWEQFVAANAILDTAFSVLIESLVEGEVEVLRTRLRKMLAEERYHFLHGRSWLNELGSSPAVEQAWTEAVEWFGPDGGKLRERLAAKLERPEPKKVEIDWSNWDPVRRRTKKGAIDRHTFDMLRGLEERRYGVTRAETPARG
ncbi:MAG: phenylacetate-CoA oxygenase subunit PaaI [Candidatus Dormibacteraeota bacterium]|nr:phenylacetate-CoA oxygenase subunit PaaI [Candidatus Dormibacteraeota bacterium]